MDRVWKMVKLCLAMVVLSFSFSFFSSFSFLPSFSLLFVEILSLSKIVSPLHLLVCLCVCSLPLSSCFFFWLSIFLFICVSLSCYLCLPIFLSHPLDLIRYLPLHYSLSLSLPPSTIHHHYHYPLSTYPLTTIKNVIVVASVCLPVCLLLYTILKFILLSVCLFIYMN